MTPILYGHPFASFVWKPLIALYERDVMFTFRIVDPNHRENQARIAELSPTGQFPALIDGDMEIAQSNVIIEYLDLVHGEAAPMVPKNPREAIEARMIADVFDDYVQTPSSRRRGRACDTGSLLRMAGPAYARAGMGGMRPLYGRRLCSCSGSILFRLGAPNPEQSFGA
jgi:glutathione S-transferase